MSDVFTLTGVLQTQPAIASASGLPSVIAQLAVSMVLQTRTAPGEYDLTTDSPVNVSFGALTGANLVFVQVNGGGHVRVRATSSDGTLAAWPVDNCLLSICSLVPITALDITRDPGVETLVDVILGQVPS
jgi:hypothetical protein